MAKKLIYFEHFKLIGRELGQQKAGILGGLDNFSQLLKDPNIVGLDKQKLSAISGEEEKVARLEGPVSPASDKPYEGEQRHSLSVNKQLQEPVTAIKLIGSSLATNLKRLSIETVGDLLYHFPHRYLDLTKVCRIAEARVGEEVTIVGEVRIITKTITRKGISIVSVGIFDGTGYLFGIWFNQEYMASRFEKGMKVAFSGRVTYRFYRLQIENPLYDVLAEEKDVEGVHTGRIVPIHPATKKVTPNMLRRIIKNALEFVIKIEDPIPTFILSKYNLLPRDLAFRQIHFPENENLAKRARDRFIFEELFLMQTGLAMRKKRITGYLRGVRHKVKGKLTQLFLENLGFDLTSDQKKAVKEILKDMSSPKPMNRLLQGEVGSGKTVVSVVAMLVAVQSGYQAAIMAPTEVLANQHYKKIGRMCEQMPVSIALLVGSLSGKEKKRLRDKIKRGEVDIVIGTHAIIQEEVEFAKLSLVVIDEQHRFGVRQRILLKEKGFYPDVLIMTATPIPRTLSLTLYGDLDVSIMKELPGGRNIHEHIETIVCDQRHRGWAYNKIKEEVAKGRQAYIVCPLVEESDKLAVKAVMEEAERLKSQVFPDLKVGIIHGRLKPEEKDEMMVAFSSGLLDVLISTTVVEVGIDIPNASVMLVEDAERFGLAQLHQLRGRIGRGKHKSYFILFADPRTEEGKKRMAAIRDVKDGFMLAEADLEIRGEGQLFGTRQSGLPDLKIAKLTRDTEILLKARKEAFELIDQDPQLKQAENALLLEEIKLRFAPNLKWLFQA
jgi:ATP-dependent DNA helicase RecG